MKNKKKKIEEKRLVIYIIYTKNNVLINFSKRSKKIKNENKY